MVEIPEYQITDKEIAFPLFTSLKFLYVTGGLFGGFGLLTILAVLWVIFTEPFEAELLAVFPMGGIFILIGFFIASFRGETVLSLDSRHIIKRSRSLFYKNEKKEKLSDFDTILIKKEMRTDSEDNSSWYVYVVYLNTFHKPTNLIDNYEYHVSRHQAHILAKTLGKKLLDETTGEQKNPEELDQRVTEHQAEEVGAPIKPENTRVGVKRVEDATVLILPLPKNNVVYAVSKSLLIIPVAMVMAYMFSEFVDLIPGGMRTFGIAVALIVVIKLIFNTVSAIRPPKLTLHTERIDYQVVFQKKQSIDAKMIKSVSLNKRSELVLVSEQQRIDIPIHSHQQDEEFVRKMVLYIIQSKGHSLI